MTSVELDKCLHAAVTAGVFKQDVTTAVTVVNIS
jgi:hypothetical protein